jgi:hypothetical protein
VIKDKFRGMMHFMQEGMARLQEEKGKDYEVGPEDIRRLQAEFKATQ